MTAGIEQVIWSFGAQGVRYEFFHIYDPPKADAPAIWRLDHDQCYWIVSPAGERLTYAEAHRTLGLSFGQFSSLIEMRQRLPRLLRP